jgi:hypothetical protein
MAMRTASGAPSATARAKTGSKGGKFPVFDHRSAMSAIKLRHNGHGITAEEVLNKVARWARAHNDRAVLNAVAAARQVDRQRK